MIKFLHVIYTLSLNVYRTVGKEKKARKDVAEIFGASGEGM